MVALPVKCVVCPGAVDKLQANSKVLGAKPALDHLPLASSVPHKVMPAISRNTFYLSIEEPKRFA